jgi:hypothetical protein
MLEQADKLCAQETLDEAESRRTIPSVLILRVQEPHVREMQGETERQSFRVPTNDMAMQARWTDLESVDGVRVVSDPSGQLRLGDVTQLEAREFLVQLVTIKDMRPTVI